MFHHRRPFDATALIDMKRLFLLFCLTLALSSPNVQAQSVLASFPKGTIYSTAMHNPYVIFKEGVQLGSGNITFDLSRGSSTWRTTFSARPCATQGNSSAGCVELLSGGKRLVIHPQGLNDLTWSAPGDRYTVTLGHGVVGNVSLPLEAFTPTEDQRGPRLAASYYAATTGAATLTFDEVIVLQEPSVHVRQRVHSNLPPRLLNESLLVVSADPLVVALEFDSLVHAGEGHIEVFSDSDIQNPLDQVNVSSATFSGNFMLFAPADGALLGEDLPEGVHITIPAAAVVNSLGEAMSKDLSLPLRPSADLQIGIVRSTMDDYACFPASIAEWPSELSLFFNAQVTEIMPEAQILLKAECGDSCFTGNSSANNTNIVWMADSNQLAIDEDAQGLKATLQLGILEDFIPGANYSLVLQDGLFQVGIQRRCALSGDELRGRNSNCSGTWYDGESCVAICPAGLSAVGALVCAWPDIQGISVCMQDATNVSVVEVPVVQQSMDLTANLSSNVSASALELAMKESLAFLYGVEASFIQDVVVTEEDGRRLQAAQSRRFVVNYRVVATDEEDLQKLLLQAEALSYSESSTLESLSQALEEQMDIDITVASILAVEPQVTRETVVLDGAGVPIDVPPVEDPMEGGAVYSALNGANYGELNQHLGIDQHLQDVDDWFLNEHNQLGEQDYSCEHLGKQQLSSSTSSITTVTGSFGPSTSWSTSTSTSTAQRVDKSTSTASFTSSTSTSASSSTTSTLTSGRSTTTTSSFTSGVTSTTTSTSSIESSASSSTSSSTRTRSTTVLPTSTTELSSSSVTSTTFSSYSSSTRTSTADEEIASAAASAPSFGPSEGPASASLGFIGAGRRLQLYEAYYDDGFHTEESARARRMAAWRPTYSEEMRLTFSICGLAGPGSRGNQAVLQDVIHPHPSRRYDIVVPPSALTDLLGTAPSEEQILEAVATPSTVIEEGQVTFPTEKASKRTTIALAFAEPVQVNLDTPGATLYIGGLSLGTSEVIVKGAEVYLMPQVDLPIGLNEIYAENSIFSAQTGAEIRLQAGMDILIVDDSSLVETPRSSTSSASSATRRSTVSQSRSSSSTSQSTASTASTTTEEPQLLSCLGANAKNGNWSTTCQTVMQNGAECYAQCPAGETPVGYFTCSHGSMVGQSYCVEEAIFIRNEYSISSAMKLAHSITLRLENGGLLEAELKAALRGAIAAVYTIDPVYIQSLHVAHQASVSRLRRRLDGLSRFLTGATEVYTADYEVIVDIVGVSGQHNDATSAMMLDTARNLNTAGSPQQSVLTSTLQGTSNIGVASVEGSEPHLFLDEVLLDRDREVVDTEQWYLPSEDTSYAPSKEESNLSGLIGGKSAALLEQSV
eukprot:CAMPEP_0178383200 /NCGR_PEP_ID=MMETSP0689_2-20121128/6880_1 /TAXON_ID=160604 /ORGANISM="Amphidinium massartii, Strain CS-259" /LENGTH=1361 /DNA_ID=CAMNT_0020003415 /DNA_START=72 /DNA_END=4158 /DNA_ORIENTATION=+